MVAAQPQKIQYNRINHQRYIWIWTFIHLMNISPCIRLQGPSYGTYYFPNVRPAPHRIPQK